MIFQEMHFHLGEVENLQSSGHLTMLVKEKL